MKTPDESVQRRNFLKGAGLVAVGAAAAVTASSRPALAQNAPAARPPSPTAASWEVSVEGAPELSDAIREMAVEDLVIPEERVADPDPSARVRVYQPGKPVFGNITISAYSPAKGASPLRDWWSKLDARMIVSNVRSRRGSVARSYHFHGCEPVSYDPGDVDAGDGSPTETLVVRPQRISMAAFGQVPADAASKLGVGLAGSDGKLELDDGFDSATGGAIRRRVGGGGSSGERQSVARLTLQGPMTSGRKALCQWITETVQGKEWRRTIAITARPVNGAPAKTFTYQDAFPTRYVFPKFSASGTGNLYEEVAIKPIRVDLG